ncbi:DUF3667 domain-containing protein [Sphingomonas sp. CGMCC 1.13654]|uniref:DUF3667 domain-containing protein n=1 Tax=Sphingomonas chungangi TaxID=2683589 RepID=A0A838L128_9SPHN|nr:DUF3667 domain-containing protein [Sphingomonas chungangi]MVW56379.1 DUF3667 domain-containing protein [Sphingomonas chungangi]
MGGAADGIGDILTGGIVAREVDRGGVASGEAGHDPHDGAGGVCLNCGATRSGSFCQDCGQSGHLHRNMMGLVHDILHGVFHFEGKFWNTLPMLAWHPGDLTRRYVHGERAKFVTPMAMFLFSVFLLFAAVNRLTMPDVSGAAAGMAKAKVEMNKAAQQSVQNLAKLQKDRADKLAADPKADTTDIDKKIKAEQADVQAMSNVAAQLPGAVSTDGGHGLLHGDDAEWHSDIPWLDRQIHGVNENGALYAYKLKMASYKYSWALIPISLPFIWLMFFWRRDVGMYDHAIFAIHSLSFMTLLAVGLIGLHIVGISSSWLWLAWLIVPPVHMYKHLKHAYGLGRFGATWRTFTLLTMTAITCSLFFAFLLWLEAE